MTDKWKARVSAFCKSPRARRIVVAAGLLGVALILLSEFLPAKKTDNANAPNVPSPTAQTAEEYTDALEQRLGVVVRGIDGVGRCRVMVTLENGVEYVYASKEKAGRDYSTQGDRLSQTDDSESSVILVQTENGYEGLLVTELQPTVKGVIVVCEGGGDATVRQRVIDAVSTGLNITSRRVCVVAGEIDGE